MPMFSRLGSYEPNLLDRTFLQSTRHYVEYLAHEATFMPVADWSLWGFRMEEWRQRAARPDAWMHAHARTLDWVRAELRERGPLRPVDLRDDAPRERGSWWDWDDAKVALEHLWRCGEVAIAGRAGFERRYALAEQVIPAAVLERTVARDDAVRELVRRAFRAYGVATESDVDDYHRLRDRSAVRTAIAELSAAGELEPVQVRGWLQSGKEVPAWRHRDAALPRRIDRAGDARDADDQDRSAPGTGESEYRQEQRLRHGKRHQQRHRRTQRRTAGRGVRSRRGVRPGAGADDGG